MIEERGRRGLPDRRSKLDGFRERLLGPALPGGERSIGFGQ